jgi:hypothetical protein
VDEWTWVVQVKVTVVDDTPQTPDGERHYTSARDVWRSSLRPTLGHARWRG